MSSIKARLIGRLGADAETVTTGTTPFISFRVAVDQVVKKEPKTTWVSVNASASDFKNLIQYLTKGKLVYVSGRLNVQLYTAKNGEPGIYIRVWANDIEVIPVGKPQDGQQGGQTQTAQPSSKDTKNAAMSTGGLKNSHVEEAVPYEPADDDLPF